ncbi:MAG: secretin N-terminal domain-containing protein [Gallionella sp.]
MLKLSSKLRGNIAVIVFTAAALTGCAGNRMHDTGMKMVQSGNIEEGLAKLEQASNADPENLEFRSDLMHTRTQIAARLLTSATEQRATGHSDAARASYERVLKIDPGNRKAIAALEELEMDRRHDALFADAQAYFAAGNLEAARAALKPILLENPAQGQAVMLQRQIDEKETKLQMAEPALTGKFKKPISLQFRDANVKMVFEALSRTSGINVLLDKDIRPDIKTSIFVKDVSIEDAIDLILMQSQLEKKILSDNTVYIYPNTPAKNKEFQDLKIRSFHLVNADPKQMLTMIKTLLKTKDIFIHEKTNSLVMRDTPDAIALAEKMIADQDIADPEVMLEVEVLEISRSRLSEIGVKYPSQITLSPIPTLIDPGGGLEKLQQLTLDTVRNINGSNIGVSPIPSITLNAMLQDSDTKILSSPRLRVRNREKAKIMIGERVPIITNTVTPVATGTPVVTGTVTYQDVGLKLDVEPEIHLDREVSIKIGLEVSSLGLAVNNASGSTVYRVGTRNTSTALRLRDGETQILAGLITDEDRSTADKVPALGQIPILGHLFSSDNGNKSKTEIILSITPHIVGNSKLPDARQMEYWSGTESDLRSSQLTLKPLGTVTLGNTKGGAAPTAMPIPRPSPVAIQRGAATEAQLSHPAVPAAASVPVSALGTQAPADAPFAVSPAVAPVAPVSAVPAIEPAVVPDVVTPEAEPAAVSPDAAAEPQQDATPVATPQQNAPANIGQPAFSIEPLVPDVSRLPPPGAGPGNDQPVMIAKVETISVPGIGAPSSAIAASTDQPMVLSWQGPALARVHDRLVIALNTKSPQAVKSMAIQVGYDPVVLKAIDVVEGNFLKRTNVPSSLSKTIDQGSGIITADVNGPSAAGTGNVVTLMFEVISLASQTAVNINSIMSTGANGDSLSILTPDPHVIAVTK